jgi:GAF domain-containing protein
MLEVSQRMNENRDTGELLDFVMDELVELCGAVCAALALLGEGEPPSFLMRGVPTEQAEEVQTRVLRYLEDFRGSRQPKLLQEDLGLDGEPESLRQLSILDIPLVTRSQLTGVIYADNLVAFGRFTQSDIDLLTVFANQAATAIENARWSRSLEQRVADRTADLSLANERLAQANEKLEQSNAELAIINRVQQGLASKLDFQAIVDLVGDEIRRIFSGQSTNIALYDKKTNLVHTSYWSDSAGKRISYPPSELSESGLVSHVIRSGKPLKVDTFQQAVELSAIIVEDSTGIETES